MTSAQNLTIDRSIVPKNSMWKDLSNKNVFQENSILIKILFISQKLLQKIASSKLETISVGNYTDITIIVFSTLIYI